MNFIEVMRERELLAQVTHEDLLAEHVTGKKRTAYAGYDPTADSLHVGSLVPTMALAHWQRCGHRVVVIVGGGTGLVGDPTGKTDMRKMLDQGALEHNIACFKRQLSQFLDLDNPEKGIIVNNADWLCELNYLSFLREIGTHFSVNRMLSAECFKQRLEKGLSFLEFNYMILQGYDFYELFKRYDCTVQLGGDDQWSNMLAGVELIRRKTSEQAFCLTLPLLTTSDGRKMGKTESGAIWLDPDKTSPYDFFQYWRNIDDADVRKAMLMVTFMDVAEVRKLTSEGGQAMNQAKERLAFELTKLVHGEKEASAAAEAARSLFSGGDGAQGNAPKVVMDAQAFGEKMNLLELLIKSDIVESRNEAKRLITQGGILLDGEKIQEVNFEVSRNLLARPEGVLLRKGKKHYYHLSF